MNDQPKDSTLAKSGLPGWLLNRLMKVIDETDEQAAAARVATLRAGQPETAVAEIADRLISQKRRATAVVGAATSGAALVPGLGTIASLSLGVAADFGVTFKMQAELVLEMAALYGHHLSPEEKRRTVLMVTGLSAGATAVAHRAGQNISRRLIARAGARSVVKAVPFAGIAASAGANAVMTHLIGKRAQAYFSLEPEARAEWRTGAAAITGIDRKSLTGGVKKGGATVVKAGGAAVSGAKRAARKVGSTLMRRQKPDEPAEDEIIPVFDKP